MCARLGLARLGGAHCYEVFAGRAELADLMADEPGTYLLTDFLALSFRRTVVAELGLDRFPELREDYFGKYRRVVWLAQQRTPLIEAAAREAAEIMGLPLEVREVGDRRLELALEALVGCRPSPAETPPV